MLLRVSNDGNNIERMSATPNALQRTAPAVTAHASQTFAPRRLRPRMGCASLRGR